MTYQRSTNTVIERLLREYENGSSEDAAKIFFSQPGVLEEIFAGLRDARELNAGLAAARRVDQDLSNLQISI